MVVILGLDPRIPWLSALATGCGVCWASLDPRIKSEVDD
jgi:hypothetical protein